MKTEFTRSAFGPQLFALLVLSEILAGHISRAQDPFTRITSGPIVSGVNCTILAWGDFNNDSFQDLFVSTRTGGSLLYSNNGNGTFSQVTTGPIPADANNCFGAAWGDYDNDGNLDLFVAVNNFGNDWLYHNNGNGSFTKITTGAIVSSGANGNNCVWADYDNDGFLDLFVANSDQNDFLYRNNRDGTFTRITTNAVALKTGNSQGAAWADYDEDGLPDLFVSRVNEPNLLYHNQGGGVFTPVTSGSIVQDVSVGQGTSWGDYDNDGHLDLFVVNPNAPNFLYHNNGDGTFTRITSGAIATDIGNGHGCGWADYDNDGFLDLFVANRLGVNFLYHNTGTGTFMRVTSGVVPADNADAVSAAWADYDNDGFPDLFVTELGSFNNRLYHNNGNSNNWITIQCAGRISNRSGIGAKVRVKATIGGAVVWQLREISGGGGLGSQNDLRAGFGLGDATNADLIRVEWPSGIVQELHDVAAKQFLNFVEAEASISPAAQQVDAGESAIFTLSTTLPPPLVYQWHLNDVLLPGETNLTLVISNVQTANAGKYSVTLANPEPGFAFTPPPAMLTGPVVITQQPNSQGILPGSNATFRVAANGFGSLKYQWQFEGENLFNATNDTLTITNVQLAHEGSYAVLVSNHFGTVQSSAALLVVLIKPVITNQLVPQTVLQGGTAVFTVVAGPSRPLAPLTYRWLRNGSAFFTSAVPTLVLTNVQTTATIRVAVTNAAQPGGLFSSNVTMTVLADFDRDGMADAWEAQYFGASSTNDRSNALLDSDGDHMSNLQEYQAGTNPNDEQSLLRLETTWMTNSISLRFTAMSNRSYTVLSCPSVTGGFWSRVADVPATPTNRAVVIIDAVNVVTPQSFYRLVTPASAHDP
jgi:hypothetical protein